MGIEGNGGCRTGPTKKVQRLKVGLADGAGPTYYRRKQAIFESPNPVKASRQAVEM